MMYFALDNDLAAGGKLTFEFADSGFTPTAGNVWDLSEATDLDAPEDDDDFVELLMQHQKEMVTGSNLMKIWMLTVLTVFNS